MNLPPFVFDLLSRASRAAMKAGPDAMRAFQRVQETALAHASRVRVRFDVALVLDLDGDAATADRGAVRLSGSCSPAALASADPAGLQVSALRPLTADEAARVGV